MIQGISNAFKYGDDIKCGFHNFKVQRPADKVYIRKKRMRINKNGF